MARVVSESGDETIAALEKLAAEAKNEQQAEAARQIMRRIRARKPIESHGDLDDFELLEVRVEDLHPDALSARLVVDDEVLDARDRVQRERQYQSLKYDGQLAELLVYKDGDVYRVTNGLARVRDAVQAGRRSLRCRVFRSRETAILAAIVDGYRRERSGVDLVRQVEILKKTQPGITQERIAESLGVSAARISQVAAHLDVDGFDSDFELLIRDGCSETIAGELLKFSKSERRKIVDDFRLEFRIRWPTKALLRKLNSDQGLRFAYFEQGLPVAHLLELIKISNKVNGSIQSLISWLRVASSGGGNRATWKPLEALRAIRPVQAPIEESIPEHCAKLSRADSAKARELLRGIAAVQDFSGVDVVRIARAADYQLRINIHFDDLQIVNELLRFAREDTTE